MKSLRLLVAGDAAEESRQLYPGTLEPDHKLPGPRVPKTHYSRLPGCDWRADHRANYLAGDHQFHTPILLPAGRGVI